MLSTTLSQRSNYRKKSQTFNSKNNKNNRQLIRSKNNSRAIQSRKNIQQIQSKNNSQQIQSKKNSQQIQSKKNSRLIQSKNSCPIKSKREWLIRSINSSQLIWTVRMNHWAVIVIGQRAFKIDSVWDKGATFKYPGLRGGARKNSDMNKFLLKNSEKNICTQASCRYFVTENVK